MLYLFSIPDGGRMRLINRALLIAMDQHPNWFYHDFKIDVAFGCPPNCIWNGNRLDLGTQFDENRFQELITFYKAFGVDYRLNFTNSLLKAEHLADDYANKMTSLADKAGCRVTVNSKLMYEYIRKKYQGLKISWSTSADYGKSVVEKIKKINELSQSEIVVLPYDLNNKEELRHLVHPENLEILVCETCIDNCPMRQQHNILTNEAILGDKSVVKNCDQIECLLGDSRDDTVRRLHFVGRKLLKVYQSIKINRFKISGRDNVEQPLAAYSYYFVIEEARQKFLDFIQSIYREIMIARGVFQEGVYYSSFYDEQRYGEALNYLYFNGGDVR